MKHVGFCGGSSFFELGEVPEMLQFFAYLSPLVSNDRDKYLLSRVYQKYIVFDEIDETVKLFDTLKARCSDEILNAYAKYFESIEWCAESAKGFYEDWGIYKAVKIIITNMPYCISEIDRPKEAYDALNADEQPFWLR